MDELRYMELDRRGAELLFQVLTEHEEEHSAAIVDPLTFGGTIIETGRYRLLPARHHPRPRRTAAGRELTWAHEAS